ncbi:hypothetical protein B0T20DRAFT_396252 [Sordaria brevicollis]|uniref:Uncharacterized protein n=1 Tax=Sordaria brevicollis TaxID=83679 RepID=A0AAE0P422_SORBR|nr:hypothetical protein B0T20DRAFT_396252 [Sordaria brevicollis]
MPIRAVPMEENKIYSRGQEAVGDVSVTKQDLVDGWSLRTRGYSTKVVIVVEERKKQSGHEQEERKKESKNLEANWSGDCCQVTDGKTRPRRPTNLTCLNVSSRATGRETVESPTLRGPHDKLPLVDQWRRPFGGRHSRYEGACMIILHQVQSYTMFLQKRLRTIRFQTANFPPVTVLICPLPAEGQEVAHQASENSPFTLPPALQARKIGQVPHPRRPEVGPEEPLPFVLQRIVGEDKTGG